MGADTFIDYSDGETAQEAFEKVRDQALYDYGHSGYSGTIAEKGSFVLVAKPEELEVETFIDYAICVSFEPGSVPEKYKAAAKAANKHVDDKWGPAGCISLGDNKYVFFGWASS